jgi:hypothetical protein
MADTDYDNVYRFRNKDKNKLVPVFKKSALYKMHINYRKNLQNHIFTNTEQKYMIVLPSERVIFAVSE